MLENITYAYQSNGFGDDELAEEFFTGWKNSPGHRENMLDPDVSETGVAVSMDAEGQYFAVQMFGHPEVKLVRFEITNESGQPVESVVNFFGTWIESLIDPAMKAIAKDPDGKLEAISFRRTWKETTL